MFSFKVFSAKDKIHILLTKASAGLISIGYVCCTLSLMFFSVLTFKQVDSDNPKSPIGIVYLATSLNAKHLNFQKIWFIYFSCISSIHKGLPIHSQLLLPGKFDDKKVVDVENFVIEKKISLWVLSCQEFLVHRWIAIQQVYEREDIICFLQLKSDVKEEW